MSGALRETEDAMRRVPWMTYALVVVCVGAFFFAKTASLEADAGVDTQLASAEEFFRNHPYLVFPSLLQRRLTLEEASQLGQRWHKKRLQRSAPNMPPRIMQREQDELDRIVETAALRIDRLPPRAHGIRATERVPQTYLSHLVFHGSWAHLVGNMVLLVVLGIFLEGAWGMAIFTCIATASTLGAAATFAFQNPIFVEPFIGTNGLLAGLTAAFLVRFAGARKDVPFGVVLIVAALVLVLPMWFGLEWAIARGAGAAPATEGAFNPSGWALVGGFGTGMLAAFVLKLFGLEGGVNSAEAEAGMRGSAVDPQFERALQERSAGNLEEAFNLLSGVLRRLPDDHDASVALWDVANELNRPRAASSAILRVLRNEVQRKDVKNTVKHWLEVVACELDRDADAALLLRVAPLLRESGYPDEAAGAFRAALSRAEGPTATSVAARVAREAADLDPQTAKDAAWRALGSPELGLEERQELESLLSVIQPQVFDEVDEDEPAQGFEPVATVSAADLLTPGEDDLYDAVELEEAQPDPIEMDARSRCIECVVASPVDLDSEGLGIELQGGHKKRLRFELIKAIAVAAVDGLGPKTVLVVDLVLNWMSLTAEPLRVIRLRTDRYDPRQLVSGVDDPLQALRILVERLLQATDATPLPDLQSARGNPFAAYQTLGRYHRDVLMVDDGSGGD